MAIIRILLIYLLIINAAGLICMYRDKQKAVHHRWRTRESTMFLVAALGGSLGILAGMHLFHHKTRHAKFRFGIPVILILQLLLLFAISSQIYAGSVSPAGVTARQLSKIKSPDADEADDLFSPLQTVYDNSAVTYDADALLESAALFYRSFSYHISSWHIDPDDPDQAVVLANLTLPDTGRLAKDVCLSLTRMHIYAEDASDALSASDILTVLQEALTNNTYEAISFEASFSLIKTNKTWQLVQDDAYHDALTGHFISYVQDPYLLSAGEILQLYLERFGGYTAGQWQNLIGQQDFFNTGTETAEAIDAAYCEKLTQVFSAEVLSETGRSDDEANASRALLSVSFHTVDLQDCMEIFHAKLLSYAGDVASVTAETSELDAVSADLLLDSITESDSTVSSTITIQMIHDGTSWYPVFDTDVIDAFTGNLSQAASILQDLDT